jgi:hypothetical protein
LDFATISTHQQADAHLQQIKQSNNHYETWIIGQTPIVYLHNKLLFLNIFRGRLLIGITWC